MEATLIKSYAHTHTTQARTYTFATSYLALVIWFLRFFRFTQKADEHVRNEDVCMHAC